MERKLRTRDGGGEVPAWIVTFADLSTLMLTFFVLLISFSNQDVVKFREMLGSVKNAFGADKFREGSYQAALTGNPAKQKEEKEEKEKEEEAKAIQQIEEVTSSVTKAVNDAEMKENAEVKKGDGSVRIRVKGEAIFASGAVKIMPKAVPFLKLLAKALKKSRLPVIVEGHTDNIPMKTARIRSNWDLSALRATVVARYLISKGVLPSRISAVGYAEMRPIGPNDSKENRAKNRRVEFLVQK